MEDPSNFSRYPHGKRFNKDEIPDIEILSVESGMEILSVKSYIDSEQEYLISCLPVVEEEIIDKDKAIVGETPAEITVKDLCVICQVNNIEINISCNYIQFPRVRFTSIYSIS